jgi:uncharacterized membrane protein YfhO
MKRAEFVTKTTPVSSDENAIQAMLGPDFDPRTHAILQQPASTLFYQYDKIPEYNFSNSSHENCDTTQIERTRLRLNSSSYSVSAACDGILVFSEPFYPGWEVFVDGRQVPVIRANYAFSAIALSAGHHTVERYYRPRSVSIGGLTSLGFMCGLFVLWKKRILIFL